ncbi:nucleoside phosphorylase domain-containing protein [Aspergillus spectabilis]
MASTTRTHDDYSVAIVCALPKKQTAAIAMLDKRHLDLSNPVNDHNAYTLGSMSNHNVVIACLPKGIIGTSSAATVATQVISTFPSVRFGLMVGIDGGVPPKVRLGDVVVSVPTDDFPGVVQWDLRKAEQDDTFRQRGKLNNPPRLLLAVLTKLESKHTMEGSSISQYMKDMFVRYPRLASTYVKSDTLQVLCFHPDYSHVSTISTHAVSKECAFRDLVNDRLAGNILCFEMEAAGLMTNFPSAVIRDICDYCDSYKNKD